MVNSSSWENQFTKNLLILQQIFDVKSYECHSDLLAVVSKIKPETLFNTLEFSLTFKNFQSILSCLFLYSQAHPRLVFVKFLLLKLERNASLRPPFCFCFEDHELRIIHSLGGEYCWIARDSEPFRLLKTPRSLSVYILIRYMTSSSWLW